MDSSKDLKFTIFSKTKMTHNVTNYVFEFVPYGDHETIKPLPVASCVLLTAPGQELTLSRPYTPIGSTGTTMTFTIKRYDTGEHWRTGLS